MLPVQGARVPSPVRELRSHMLHGTAKTKNKSLATLDDTHESNPAGFVKEGIYIHLLSIRFV